MSRRESISRKSKAQLDLMRRAGAIVAETLQALAEAASPGVTTRDLDRLAEEHIRARGAVPSFLGYRGYPATICAEIDDVVVHGIPDDRPLREGMILGLDLGASYSGYHGDAALTVAIGEVATETLRLMRVTEEALALGIAAAVSGARLRAISHAIQRHVESHGCSAVRALVGHGIGRAMHEPPQVPNFVDERQFRDYEVILRPGMTLAIEPMVNLGTPQVVQDADGWTVRTADGRPSAHFEHTIAVTEGAPEILTRL